MFLNADLCAMETRFVRIAGMSKHDSLDELHRNGIALNNDHDFPKGLYLRCIEGALWLRGSVGRALGRSIFIASKINLFSVAKLAT